MDILKYYVMEYCDSKVKRFLKSDFAISTELGKKTDDKILHIMVENVAFSLHVKKAFML